MYVLLAIPTPVDVPEDKYIHSNYCNLADQIKYLQMNPQADYMIWGHPSSPNLPMALEFWDMQAAMLFVYHRQNLFKHGPWGIESLVFLIMTLRPILQRKKISPDMLYRQLGREYSDGYVEIARGMIQKRPEDGKEVYASRFGKVYEVDDVPISTTSSSSSKEMLLDALYQLKAAGRFPELAGLPADRANMLPNV